MAVGDTVSAWGSKATTATTDVQPGAGVEWLIHTLVSQSGKSMEVYLTSDGSTFTLVDTLTGGSVHGLTYRLTNTIWMRLKNIDAGTAYNGYEGVVTK
jgi:hypothetical protein